MVAKEGDVVQIEYTGKFSDGEVFDSSEKHGQPLTFTIGEKQVIVGFEEAIVGMNEGEEKEVEIPPSKGYGEKKDDLQQEVPRDQLPPEAKEGMQLLVTVPTGHQVPVRIKNLTEDTGILDLNHPLAGRTLHFQLKLVKIGA